MSSTEPQTITRETLASMSGPVIVEFGAAWCGICQAFAPHMQQLRTTFPMVQHLKIEDGKGKPLGRSFGVTLWPTFVILRDGEVRETLVRPPVEDVRRALQDVVQGE